jgi:hypothetical protein
MRKSYFVPLLVILMNLLTPACLGAFQTPTQKEEILLSLFKEFEDKYVLRQRGMNIPGDNWLNIAKGLQHFSKEYDRDTQVGRNYYLRANLIRAECYLFASQVFFKENDSRFLDYYERGIVAIGSVIRQIESHSGEKGKIDFLPDFSDMNIGLRIHPFAGYESIGTGFGKGFEGREVTWAIQNYASLNQYSAFLTGRHGTIRQISSSQTARKLLAGFCPWGVEIYFLLKQAGLTSGVDFRILRPFAEGFDKSLHAKVLNNMEALFSSQRKYVPYWEVSPIICDLSLSSDKVSCSMKAEMDCIVDEKNCKNALRCQEEEKSCTEKQTQEGIENSEGLMTKRDKTLKIHVDTVGNLGNKKIRWLWVSDPTYNIWYISPTVYNWNTSDYAKVVFNSYKWASGGIVWGGVGLLMDQVGEKITNEFFNFFEASPFPIPFLSNILTEGVKDQYSSFLTGEKISPTGTIQTWKWIKPEDMFMDFSSYIFDFIESADRELFFGKLNPEDMKMGTTYDGTEIPPVVLVSNVTGVQDVPEDDYPKYLNVVRFYVMYPKMERKTVSYDLRNPGFFWGEQKKYCVGWSKVKSPFGSYEIVTSFAPRAQILKFKLDKEAMMSITDSDTVELELWATTMGEDSKYATASVDQGDDSVTINLFNQDDPLSKIAYENWLVFPEGHGNITDRDMAATVDTYLRSERDAKARRGDYETALVSLKTQYELVVKVNNIYVKPDRKEDKYLINLYSGPRGGDENSGARQPGGKKPVTGTLSSHSADPSYLQLDYERIIKLPLANVTKDFFYQGRNPK